MSQCNHRIGEFDDMDLYVDNYIILLKEGACMNAGINEVYKHTAFKKSTEDPLEFMDGRLGYIIRNNYCPNCGEKLNWKTLKQKLQESL